MAKTKKKKDSGVNLMMFFKGRVSTILGLVFVILFLAASVGIPLSYYFDNKVTLWVSMGFLFGSALGVVVIILWLAYQYSSMLSRLGHDVSHQIDAFAKGNFISVNKEHHLTLPGIVKIQQKVNQAIADYTNYRLVFVGKASEEAGSGHNRSYGKGC